MTNRKILIVEDTALVAHHLQHILSGMGYKDISMTPSGEEALDLFEANQYDLVLMDIMLEGPLNGIDTARKIKTNSNTPVIFVTALSDSDSLGKINSVGDGYFMKPFVAQEVIEKVKECLLINK